MRIWLTASNTLAARAANYTADFQRCAGNRTLFLIDSNVLINASRGNTAAIEYADGLRDSWALSQVTALELVVVARDKRDLALIDGFFSTYPVVPLSDSIGTRAYGLLKTYAKSHGLHVFDSLVAATAIEKALTRCLTIS